MRVIRVGIIGLSAQRGWAAGAHLPALQSHPGYEIVALSASSPQSGRAAAAAYDVPRACDDAAELVELADVDLVVVGVRVSEHFKLVTAALEAGKDVLCEWPLGNGADEAEELAQMADEKGVRSFVMLQARSLVLIRHLRDFLAQKGIGEVLSSTLLGCGPSYGPSTTAATIHLLDQANGGTMVSIPFGHTIDAVCYCLGELVEVEARIANLRPTVSGPEGEDVPKSAPDQLAVSGAFESGAVFTAHYRGGVPPFSPFRWEIEGSKGSILIEGPSGHLQLGGLEATLIAEGGESIAFEPGAGYDGDYGLDRVTGVANTYARLYRDIVEGTDLVPSFHHAARRQALLDTIERAAAAGERRRVRE
jgi:predicted dehydrogenase